MHTLLLVKHVCTLPALLLNPYRAGTGVVVASLYYQSAGKAKDSHGGKSGAKESPKASNVLYKSVSGIKSSGGTRERNTSFAGLGQVPRRSSAGHDEEAAEAAALLQASAVSEQK